MPTLHRVFPYLDGAAEDEPGGALFVPRGGAGRVENPELYSVLYLSDAEAGAISEAFGRFPEWTPAVLAGSPALPGSARAIATYRISDGAAICDLDDAAQLVELGLRPSDVASRDYARTRAWARRIYHEGGWSGLQWWSYYDPRWASVALWDLGGIEVEDVRKLRLDDASVGEASRTILRRIVG